MVSFMPHPLHLQGKSPQYPLERMDPRAGLDVVVKSKIPAPAQNQTTAVQQPIA